MASKSPRPREAERPGNEWRLVLVRHAIAAERGDEYPDDELRPLTRPGRARMAQAVRGLRVLDLEIEVVFTSPLTRARETADILVKGLEPAPKLMESPALAPGGRPEDVASSILGARAFRAAAALVGHEPDLGELAAWLLGARAPLPFKKGGMARIDVTPPVAAGSGQLVWFATPKMLRAMGQ